MRNVTSFESFGENIYEHGPRGTSQGGQKIKKKILISNQRVGEFDDIIKVFGLNPNNLTSREQSSITNLWNELESDYEKKTGNPSHLPEGLFLIEISLDPHYEEFTLDNYEYIPYEGLNDLLGVDLYQFNGYL